MLPASGPLPALNRRRPVRPRPDPNRNRSHPAMPAIRHLLTLPALALLLLALVPAQAVAGPAPYVAEYDVLRKGKPAGRAEVRLSREGQDWILETQTRGTAGMAAMAGLDVSERSRFVLGEDGLPEARDYRYSQRAAMRSRERSLSVDAQAGRIDSRDRDRQYALEYRPGVLDRQLIAFALARSLAADAEAVPSLWVADRERIGEQRFRNLGSERIRVPAGEFDAIALERARDDGSRQTRYWIDPERGITLRLLQTEEKGDGVELRLVRYSAGD